jgi:hypothetical protein
MQLKYTFKCYVMSINNKKEVEKSALQENT